jgi:hypothetical protein
MAKFQKTIVGDNTTYADLQGWAGDIIGSLGTGTGIASALYNLGFTKLSDTYSAPWSTSGAAVPTNAGNLFGATFATTTSNARNALAAAAFQGAWVTATGNYTVGQVVTNAGLVFICTTAIASSSTAPASDTAHWSQYFMEIWSMVASGLTTVYIKLEYGGGATAANPQLSIQFGTAYVANSGVISGNVSTVEQCFGGAGVATSSECDWAGDGQNWFGMFMHRGNVTHSAFVCFERGISGQTSGAPVYSTTNQYITYIVGNKIPVWHQCSLFLGTGIGTVNSIRLAYAAVVNLFVAGTQVVNNITPALPIFPLVGWTGNPMSVVQAYSVTDSAEGVTISSSVYGSTVSYLQSINTFVGQLGGTASIYALGLKWQ